MLRTLAFVVAGCSVAAALHAQQTPNPSFDSSVAKPAYTATHPRVLFDEAHFNFHTSGGRYKPFADLLQHDGYEIVPNRQKFTAESLRGSQLLVIANARGADTAAPAEERARPAFTAEECQAVRRWVEEGGALLVIADHYPIGSATEVLAKEFGVEMSKGFTDDPFHYERSSGEVSQLVFTREEGLITDHPITRGRDRSERIGKVVAFTGQSLKGPKGAEAFLRLSKTAFDRLPPDFKTMASAAGRAEGLALRVGRGRAVFLGEAAMLTAQGEKNDPVGMNRPDLDNRQLALNIAHWLTGVL